MKDISKELIDLFKDSQFKVFLDKKLIPFITESVLNSQSVKRKNANDPLLGAIQKLTIEIENLKNEIQTLKSDKK